MADFADYLEDAILNFWLRNNPGALTSPATVYVALFTADPTDAGSFTNEVSQATNSYARQAVTFGAPSGGQVSNTGDVVFSDMPATTITHFAIVDSGTYQGGNALYTNALGSSATLAAGDTYTLATGNITIAND